MRIGLVGAGIMGEPMGSRLLAAGHEVRVYNRTQSKAQPLIDKGAVFARTPALASQSSDVVISMVSDPAAVAALSLDSDGILGALPATAVHCDMSTVTPGFALHMAESYARRNRRFVQAPVLGSKKQIADGTLIVFAGGADQDIDRCQDAWSAFASTVRRFPAADQAATTKLACNMLIAQMILGLGQSLLYARKGGVDPGIVLEIIQESNLAAPMYGSKGKTLLSRNFAPNFFVRHMLKDLNLAAQSAADAGLPQPMNAAARELFVAAMAQNHGDEDYSAVVKVLEDLAGVNLS
jgi:3-hydroxyisobutyrate dehydrogenase-like beta-hydroxyacid dehydrogenase